MHDPLVVAFEIRRPWPRRQRHGSAPASRWRVSGSFWEVAGRRYWWPPMVTVWHREPDGRDSGEVCRQYRKWQDADGRWQTDILHGWKLHVHHWKVQVHPLQHLRRRLLTRCAWCGGRDRKRDPVNVSHQWDGPRGRWWQGEPGLFHGDCTSVAHAHRKCFCPNPGLSYGDHGQCAFCGRYRAYRTAPDEADRLLASLPAGARITPEIRPQIEALWDERRKRRESAG
jgi:hypothetical protein